MGVGTFNISGGRPRPPEADPKGSAGITQIYTGLHSCQLYSKLLKGGHIEDYRGEKYRA